ncbi:MAG: FAD-binding oxidoreductase [Sphingomonas bacterium]|nr:FAD-binding protein [Sphingomonas bacterium]MDB5688659.1 FAD-binding oxidoreductase [Sphingomonas bacterium]
MSNSAPGGSIAITQAGEYHPYGSAPFQAAVARAPLIIGAQPEYVALVRPGSAEELARAVKQAREQKLGILRLYNESNVGARLRGDGRTLIVDLSRMNRVLEINADHGYARVEPGVSFAGLARHIAEQKLPLLVDSGRDSAVSVTASVFDKGFGYTPYCEHTLVQCGGEYVLPDGDRLRTGMGAMADNRTWQLYKYALGPFSDGLAVQSDLMVPTQMGIWLMGTVPAFRPFAIDLEDDAALAAALELIRPLKITNALPGAVAITHRDFDASRAPEARRGAKWRLYGALYGIPAVVEMTMQAIASGFGGIKAARLFGDEQLGNDPLWREHKALMAGQVLPQPARVRGDEASLTFVGAIEGEAAHTLADAAGRVLSARRIPMLVDFTALGRSLMLTVHLPYDRRRADSVQALEASGRALVTEMAEAGHGLASESVEFSRIAPSMLGNSGLATLQGKIAAAFA